MTNPNPLTKTARLVFLAGILAGSGISLATFRTTWKEPTTAVVAIPSSVLKTDEVAVAKIFGRVRGCSERADAILVQTVVENASANGIKPPLLAATLAVESWCEPLAVSARGAVGLMQVRPKIWAGSFDFSGRDNLFNPGDNIRVGARILAGLVKAHGEAEGVRLYQGDGRGCASCDDGYAGKILSLVGVAGKHKHDKLK